MEYENKILNLFKNGYLTTKDVTENNIPRTYLTKLIKENKIDYDVLIASAVINGRVPEIYGGLIQSKSNSLSIPIE